jgi:folate-binding protein YgfZ
MYYAMSSRSVIKLCGPDGFKFLNNLSTNKIQTGQLIYTYFLNNQGRYLYDGFLYMQDAENIYLDMSAHIIEHFLKYIALRKLRSKFDIIELKDHQVVYSEDQIIDDNLIFARRDPRDQRMGYRAISPSPSGTKNEDLYQDNRFRYVVIEGCYDMIYEKSIPIEYNAEEQNALSFDKGCYVGQEVISRAKYQGVVRKKVFLLKTVSGDMREFLEQGEVVMDESGDKLGVVCSHRGMNVLALLNKDKMHLVEQKEKRVYIGSYSFICV